ncbi:aminopeptidase P family protein [bacterium]|nr:aminopeptidase P family protein [bacterium]MBU1985000.1 aminopeptidase P family protein [bacterium]
MNVRERLAALRRLMKKYKVHAYLVPSTDPHQSEYVPEFWRRREWISGFTGSAGDVIITERKAALWTDGRYFLQADAQLAGSGIKLMKLGLPETPGMTMWLSKTLKRGNRVGVDPRVLSVAAYQKLRQELDDFGLILVGIEDNLIDPVWLDRMPAPDGVAQVHPLRYSGESVTVKLRKLRRAMKDGGALGHVVAALDQIAWLFNVRGSDVQHNPVVIAYAIVTHRSAMLFVDRRKISPEVRRALGTSVQIRDYSQFGSALQRAAKSGSPWWIDGGTTNQWIANSLRSRGKIQFKPSPITPLKAAKNAAELRGARAAHVRDGVAMVRFLHWLENAVGREPVTEITAAEELEGFRSRSKLFRGLSFDTIAGYAAHGAIIHYSATPETDVRLRKRGLLVLDSGAQYIDGTTDITRTIALGRPTREQKEHFTRVLKGHIHLATASFPVGTSGKQLDTLARKALWDVGLDYGHGTGHGVGSYLSVHEGPQSISPTRDTGAPLVPGMICSNEPGFYKAGEYGIRIENLVYIVPDKERSQKGRKFLAFENLTLCPIDRNLIDTKLLTPAELRYLNSYHSRVRRTLTRFLSRKEAAWLAKATRPIK